jgi:hypothetical protein
LRARRAQRTHRAQYVGPADAGSPWSPDGLTMRDFDDSTLWRISAYERMRSETGESGFARLNAPTSLPATLVSELAHLEHARRGSEVLDVVAACLRQRESALIVLRHDALVWPLTLFPQQGLYQLVRPIIESLESSNLDLRVISVEPPGWRPPGHAMHERVADLASYRPLPALLWAMALHAPRTRLLDDIAGRAAYRLSANFTPDPSALAGALSAALRRLRSQGASLDEIARWPGMDRERATRLLNGLYLQGGLMVLRAHPAARTSTGGLERLRNFGRPPR